MKPNLIINGAAGRMGRRIVALVAQGQEFDIIAAIDRPGHGDIGKDAGVLAGIGEINVKLDSEYPATADVMIDFSLAEAVDQVTGYCVENNVALIMGTTGLNDSQAEKLRRAGKKIPIVRATNMSVGMNVLFRLVGKVAQMLGPEYDIEVVERTTGLRRIRPAGRHLH